MMYTEMSFCFAFAVQGFPGAPDGKESACNAGNLDSIPGLGRSHRKRNG